MTKLDKALTTELEAAAFRRLLTLPQAHRRAEHRPHEPRRLLPQLPLRLVPGGRSREGRGAPREAAREIVYGMPYKEWQAKHQKEASAEALAALEKSKPH